MAIDEAILIGIGPVENSAVGAFGITHSQESNTRIVKFPYNFFLYFGLYLYEEKMRNIPLCLKKFTSTKPKVTPEGKGVYLNVYPEWIPNMDCISFFKSLG